MSIVQIKPIVPRGDVVPDLESIIQEQIKRAARDTKAEYEKTVRTWKRNPGFEIVMDSDSAIIGTDSEIYGYIDEGTRPHKIRPKRAKSLRFQTGYTAKTRPNVVGSRRGGASGPVAFAQEVNHPGFPARNFTKQIVRKQQGRFTRRVTQAIRRAVRDQNRKVRS